MSTVYRSRPGHRPPEPPLPVPPLDAPPKAVPQVPEERRFEVRERIDHTGRVLTGLTDEAAGEVVRKVADSGAGAPFRVTIETAPGEAYELPGKATVRLGRDDKVIVESCGGGYRTPTPQQEEQAG